ncbi:3-demethylubiquinone-9 3-methyltransferase family protein [Burkholderia thailandensis USAMRU Malaysia |nr:VOC family protein [Burkholderia thailandensis]AHI82161.1 3-demethylubiquinone-9 3-methyltransferase family protein [Burkholderia thailandensis E444]AIC89893.1 3-demethylubiquinone-9 3-methyltransferase family protein [Burkholderia thailandensis USAMRU Malaysia \
MRARRVGIVETALVARIPAQAELDRYWSALLDGGAPDDCGWLRDRFGVSWQIVPDDLIAMMANPDPDPAKAARVADAMLRMRKFDVAALKAACAGVD